MQLREDLPHFMAFCKDSAAWRLRADQWDSFMEAWAAGRPLWIGIDAWDQRVVVKMTDVLGLCEATDASIALGKAEGEVKKKNEILGIE